MRRFSLIYVFSLMTACTLQAQTTHLMERQRTALSPSEQRFKANFDDMDVRCLNQLYSNPVYYEWVHTSDSLFSKSRYRNAVYTGYANGEQKGDFLPYEGNGSFDYRVGALGEYSLRYGGVLFGSAQYSRGKHENIGWSAMRYPELYTPYISTDSIGGDFLYEDYLIQGGYAFTLGQWKLGVNGLFHGEQAHRKTDPRALNNTTWLSIGAGVSRMLSGHLLIAQGKFGRNKQHLNMSYWRPGEQDRFFVCYGFGLYDVRESKVSFGYSRMYYIKEGEARLTYQSPQNNPFVIYASVGYEYDRMKTEESSICDLYYSKTNTFLPSVRLDWKPSSSWELSLWMDGRMDMRKGFENIFERYQSDVNNNIYDYRLIDTQQHYFYDKANLLGQLRVRYHINDHHTVGLLGGASANYRREQYKSDGYEIKNLTMFPHGRLDYQMNVKRSELDLSFLFGKKLVLDNKYQVDLINNSIEHLDFQHAFAPYAYYNSTCSSLQLSASYVYHFKRCGLGANVKFMYVSGDRDSSTRYDKTIGFTSTAPMISPCPDKHDEMWGSSSVFLVF